VIDEVSEDRFGDAFAQMGGCGSHRFDFGMTGFQRLECTTAQQFMVLPGGPESDVGLSQGIESEGMHAFGWRKRIHAVQVFLEQAGYLGTAQVIDFDFHGGS
jgi:hypothetical protein